MPKTKELKLPPNSDESESSVLGSLLIDGACIEKVATFLKPDDFFYDQNRYIYEGCLNLYKRHEAINNVTLSQELTRLEKLEECGGASKLSYLISQCPTSLDIEHYANIVARLSMMRQIISAGDRIAAIGYESDADVDKSLGKIDATITSLRKSYGKVDIVTPRERADMLLERYNGLKNLENSPALPTGFYNLDKLLGGGQFPGELTIIGGDSGLGKSTLAQDIAINQSQYGDVLFCSGEMTVEALSDKEIAKLSGCSVIDIRAGKYDEKLFDQIIDSVGEISERKLYIYRGIPLTVQGIRQAAYNMASQHNLVSIWIDYLQKIELAGGREENVYRKIGNITTDMANLAKELKVPINILCQLNRDVNKRDDKRPDKSLLFESSIIEHDADFILLLYRIDKYTTKEEWDEGYANLKTRATKGWNVGYSFDYPEGVAEIIIEKTRFGDSKRKIAKVIWNSPRQSYENLYQGGEM